MADDGIFISAEGDLLVSSAGDALMTSAGKCPECGCGGSTDPCCSAAGATGFYPVAGSVRHVEASVEIDFAHVLSAWEYFAFNDFHAPKLVAPTVTIGASYSGTTGFDTTIANCSNAIVPTLQSVWDGSSFVPTLDGSGFVLGTSSLSSTPAIVNSGVGPWALLGGTYSGSLFQLPVASALSGTVIQTDAGFDPAKVIARASMQSAYVALYVNAAPATPAYVATYGFSVEVDVNGKVKAAFGADVTGTTATGSASATFTMNGSAVAGVEIAFNFGTVGISEVVTSGVTRKRANTSDVGTIVISTNMQGCSTGAPSMAEIDGAWA